MEFIKKLAAHFFAKPAPAAPAPLYSDAEFLEVVADLARQRTRAEQAAVQATRASAAPGQAFA